MTKKANWIIIGRHPVNEAIDSGIAIDKVLVDRQSFPGEIVDKCRRLQIPVQKVPREKLDKFGTNHQGIAAFKAQVNYTSLEDLIPHLFEQGHTPLLLILDGITDVGNFGAISRSAEALGAHGMIFPSKGSAQLNADAVKRSAGALLNVPLCRVDDLTKAVRFLKESGISVIAAAEKGGLAVQNVDFRQPCAIILGSEDMGISLRLLKLCDGNVFIPQTGKIDSLNVSVAAGILLYEVNRQRTNH